MGNQIGTRDVECPPLLRQPADSQAIALGTSRALRLARRCRRYCPQQKSLTPTAGWTHRQTLLTYCINTVEGSMNAKRAAAGGPTDERLVAAPPRPAGVQGGAHERGVREEQAVSDALHSESSVEAIVRKRTLEGESQ